MRAKTAHALAFVLPLSGPAGPVALAQVGTTAVAPPSPAAKTQLSPEERKTRSAECSKQADTKSLHGKERKKFRSDCMKM
jgi:hypothetical protein